MFPIFPGLPTSYTIKYIACFVVLVGLAAVVFYWRAKRRRKGHRPWPADSFLALLAAALTLLLGEGAVVRFGDLSDSYSLTKLGRLWYARHVRTNKLGFRDDHDYTRTPPPGKRRIAFLGDSFTLGHGIDRLEDRFTNRIAAKLELAAPGRWEVVNLAQAGWETAAQASAVQQLAEQGFRADLVILVYVLNDTSDLLAENVRFNEQVRSLEPKNLLVRKSFLLDFLYYRYRVQSLKTTQDYFSWSLKGYQPPIWERQQQRLRALRRHCESLGNARFAVVTFPYVHDLANDRFAVVHRRLEDFWNSEGVNHLDLRAAFQRDEPRSLSLHRFDAHPNVRAHRLAADEIWEKLLKPLAK